MRTYGVVALLVIGLVEIAVGMSPMMPRLDAVHPIDMANPEGEPEIAIDPVMPPNPNIWVPEIPPETSIDTCTDKYVSCLKTVPDKDDEYSLIMGLISRMEGDDEDFTKKLTHLVKGVYNKGVSWSSHSKRRSYMQKTPQDLMIMLSSAIQELQAIQAAMKHHVSRISTRDGEEQRGGRGKGGGRGRWNKGGNQEGGGKGGGRGRWNKGGNRGDKDRDRRPDRGGVKGACSQVMCMMYCEHGFEKDINGCDRCACRKQPVDINPCATMRCAAGTYCKAIEVQCIRAPCPRMGKCISSGPSNPGVVSSGCPPPPTGMMGTCVEGCSSDAACGPGQMCCSNGCGKTCITVATPAPCSPVRCRMHCPNGWQRDSRGCEICRCNRGGGSAPQNSIANNLGAVNGGTGIFGRG